MKTISIIFMIRKSSYKRYSRHSVTLMFLLLVVPLVISADDLEIIVNLEGSWKFSIGDNPEWATEGYDDSEWDFIRVPESWEANGYNDYNGFAWYRKTFMVSDLDPERNYFLLPGYIDDVDEVYLNGELIGRSGVMPPLVVTAHEMYRRYPIPWELLKSDDENLIAVRVYDEYERGGIYAGPVGIVYDREDDLLAVNLSGFWAFEDYKRSDDDTANAVKMIYVPGYWENQGYPDLDGSAVYSREFQIPPGTDIDDLMLVMGYIDDLDKVYINGVRVGAKEYRENNYDNIRHMDVVFRGYRIPPGTLRAGTNKIEVRVVDTGGLGGIYRGPVGLVTQYNLRRLVDNHNTEKTWFDKFLEDFFGWY